MGREQKLRRFNYTTRPTDRINSIALLFWTTPGRMRVVKVHLAIFHVFFEMHVSTPRSEYICNVRQRQVVGCQ